MKRILIGVAAVMLVTLMSGPVLAGSQDNAVLALHLRPHVKGDPCTGDPATLGITCNDYVVDGDLSTSYDVYLMVAEGAFPPGVAALSCGIAYNGGACGASTMTDGTGVDVFAWTLCTSGLEFTNGCTGLPADEWPAAGGGNRITWDASVDCQETVVGVNGVSTAAGAFYVYAYTPDYLAITPNMNLLGNDELQVGDCDNSVSDLALTQKGYIRFSAGATLQGCNPCLGECDEVAVAPSTWGRIKQQY